MPKARFQTFTTDSRADLSPGRIAALRAALAAQSLDALLLPRADIFQGEYLPPSEQRLAWLTGFSGSAGFAIVLQDRLALFVDGRYTVQARAEVDPALAIVPLAEQSPEAWLQAAAGKGMAIGYDSRLFTPRGLKRFAEAAERAGARLQALAADPFAGIWADRPAPPATPVVEHPLRLAGESIKDKLARLQARLKEEKLDALVVSECPSVNWLFNIRAGDVPHLPILRAFAFVPAEGRPALFVDARRISAALGRKLATSVEIVPTQGDGDAELIAHLGIALASGARVRIDEESTPALIADAIAAMGCAALAGPDPLALMKAAKNATELEGARAAHLRDGVAVTRFLAWLARESAARTLDEIECVIALENFRRETGELRDVSFPTIAGAGPNAALPHYRVTDKTNRKLTPGMFLFDSGGQYRDGTTDITRTIAIGKSTPDMRAMFTHVLRGMIAISRAVFPKGTSGAQLDTLARQFLWNAGRDFDHGTGHGVGSYLSVHEGPQRISKFGTTTLRPGMILSNEPGYYREGAFGIRIENLVAVEAVKIAGAEREMLGFETLTLAPIDRQLIVKAMLTRDERDWLDTYHARVLKSLGPALDRKERAYLKDACRPL